MGSTGGRQPVYLAGHERRALISGVIEVRGWTIQDHLGHAEIRSTMVYARGTELQRRGVAQWLEGIRRQRSALVDIAMHNVGHHPAPKSAFRSQSGLTEPSPGCKPGGFQPNQ